MPRQSKGRLFTRGKQKRFYLQYYINGKQFVVALKDQEGAPITNRRKAEFAATDLLNPISAASKAERLKKIRDAVEDADAKAARLAAEDSAKKAKAAEIAKNRLATVADGWKLFMACPKRPASCKMYSIDATPRHSTAGNYKGYYDRFINWIESEHPETLLLSNVTPEIADAFMQSVQKNSSGGTYNKYVAFFKRFFQVLMQAEKIICSVNPFADIERVEHRSNSKKPLSIEQIVRLIDAASGEMKLLVALGYFTGLRQGDCSTLKWSEINLTRGIIERIPRKTAHSSAISVKIGIAPALHKMLDAIPPENREGYLLPDVASDYLNGKETQLNHKLMKLFEQCGIAVHRPGTGEGGQRAVVEAGFHSLRYSYISHNAEAGTPAAIIQSNAGHSNPAMTEHYTRISDRAAVKYAAVLSLPESGKKSDFQIRAKLHSLIDTMSIEKVKEILNQLQPV